MQPQAWAERIVVMRLTPSRTLALVAMLFVPALASDDSAEALVRAGLEAEQRLDTHAALTHFLDAARERPDDAFILQRIARQYSDSEVDARTVEEKRRLARLALDYAERAHALDPHNPEIVLSLAISHGKLAIYSDTRTKIQYSRLVRQQAERALELDANYDWAHHVLGRWHHEVASLGTATRFFVDLVYGGLPDASPAAAIRHLERAVDLAPDTVAHHLELGFAYLAAGRSRDAREAFERGLALPNREKHDESAKQRAEDTLRQLG